MMLIKLLNTKTPFQMTSTGIYVYYTMYMLKIDNHNSRSINISVKTQTENRLFRTYGWLLVEYVEILFFHFNRNFIKKFI